MIGVGQISVLARFLQPADFGTVAILMIILAIANVFVTVGFSDVLIVKHEATTRQLSTMYWLNVIVGLTAYIAIFFGAPLLSMLVEREGIASMARVMGLSLIMGSSVVQFYALMRRELRLKQLAVIQTMAHLAGFVAAISFAISGFGVWSLIFAGLATQLVTSVCLLFLAGRYQWYPQRLFQFDDVFELIRFGLFRIGAALLNTLNTKVDQLAIGAFLGTTALGFYTIAYNFAMQPFTRINPILTKVSFPVFAKIKHDDARLLRGYRKGLRILMVINAPLLIGLIASAPLFIPALLGPGWERSIPILQILCIFVVFRSASNINIGLILAKEKYRWPLYWNLLLVLLFPATIFVVAYVSQSLLVVSLSLLGVQVFLSLMAYLLFAKRILGGFALGYLSDFGRPVLTSALMGVAVFWLQSQLSFASPWLGLALILPAGAVLYICFSFFLQRQHIEELIAVLRSRV